KIPLPFSTIYQLNLLAALYCAASVSIFTYTAKYILDNFDQFAVRLKKNDRKKSKKQKKDKSELKSNTQTHTDFSQPVKIYSAVLAGLSLAFSKTFWFQSTSVEVYSFHILLMSLIILFLIKAFVNRDEPGENYKSRSWLWFALFLALGFTNHMTTLLILPGVAYLYFNKWGFNKVGFYR